MGLRRRRVPAGGIGCEPACVRAPLKSVSHPNWLTAAPWNGPPSTLSALSLADSRKTLALGLLLWDVNGAWRWHLVPGYLGGPFYDKGGGRSPRIKPLVATLKDDAPEGSSNQMVIPRGNGRTEGAVCSTDPATLLFGGGGRECQGGVGLGGKMWRGDRFPRA